MAETYRQTEDHAKAAAEFERFVDRYPKHKMAETALRYASILRKTLGHDKAAVRNLERFLKVFGRRNKSISARVHLDIVLIEVRRKAWQRVLTATSRHLKVYRRESAGTRLRVLAARATALTRLRKKKTM